MFKKLSRSIKHFLKSLDDHERKILNIVLICFLVLIIGGIILYFTKGNEPAKTGVVELTCRDTDGNNTHTKGAVTYTDAKGRHTDEDYCTPTDGAVFEMTCHKTSFWSFASVPETNAIACPKGCINGACTK